MADPSQTASPKGLVAGLRENGEAYELVPDRSTEELHELLSNIQHNAEWKWILVVEKEVRDLMHSLELCLPDQGNLQKSGRVQVLAGERDYWEGNIDHRIE